MPTVNGFKVLLGAATAISLLVASGCSAGEPEPAATETLSYAQRMEVWTENTASCLRDRGWDATSNIMSVRVHGVPPGQEDAYRADYQDCWGRYGEASDPEYGVTVTPEAASSYFAALQTGSECLRELGFNVPDAPSEQSFVNAIVNTGNLLYWDPFEVTWDENQRNALGVEINEIREQCPQPNLWEFVH